MPVQGGRPTVRTRFSGIRNVFSGLGGVSNQSNNSGSANVSSTSEESDEISERLSPEELVLTKVTQTAHLWST